MSWLPSAKPSLPLHLSPVPPHWRPQSVLCVRESLCSAIGSFVIFYMLHVSDVIGVCVSLSDSLHLDDLCVYSS